MSKFRFWIYNILIFTLIFVIYDIFKGDNLNYKVIISSSVTIGVIFSTVILLFASIFNALYEKNIQRLFSRNFPHCEVYINDVLPLSQNEAYETVYNILKSQNRTILFRQNEQKIISVILIGVRTFGNVIEATIKSSTPNCSTVEICCKPLIPITLIDYGQAESIAVNISKKLKERRYFLKSG